MGGQVTGLVGGGSALTPILQLASLAGMIKSMVDGGMGSGREKESAQPQGIAPTAPNAPSEASDKTNFGAQPAAATAPTFLGVSGALSPEQQRSRIATMALAGGNSAFTGNEASDFYKNVAQRSLTDEAGGVAPNASVLPVERQYAQQVLGKKLSRDSTEHFLTQLLSP